MSEIVIIEDSEDEDMVSPAQITARTRSLAGMRDKKSGPSSQPPAKKQRISLDSEKASGLLYHTRSKSPTEVTTSQLDPIDLEPLGDSRQESKADTSSRAADHVQSFEERRSTNAQASSLGHASSAEKWIAPFQLLRANGIPDYANRPPTGMRLRDVVYGAMKWVLVSNYMVDMGWLLTACPDLKHAGFVQVVHGESHPTMLRLMKEEGALVGLNIGRNFALHAPPLPIPYGTHHSKAFLVEYETGLRVVIHTANLVHCDNNFKTQGLWVQDFPKKDSESPGTSTFEKDLLDYLRALQIPTPSGAVTVIARCKQYDFSSARAHLIASSPGRHAGPAGHKSLQAKLAQETFDSEFKRAPVFAQFSSLGSLDAKWLHQEFQQTLCAGRTQNASGSMEALGSSTQDGKGFHLIWPTVDEVRNSLEGWTAGRSIPGFEKNVKKPFLQTQWHRFGGEPMCRQRAMPHIKTYGRYRHLPGEGTKLAWFVLASHNLSKAAWGNLQAGQTMFIRSYELGVLFLTSLENRYRLHRHCGFSCTAASPVMLPQAGASDASVSVEFWTKTDPSDPMDQHKKMYLPVPFKLPPKAYSDNERPWMADFPFPGVDVYGKGRDDEFPPIYGFTE